MKDKMRKTWAIKWVKTLNAHLLPVIPRHEKCAFNTFCNCPIIFILFQALRTYFHA